MANGSNPAIISTQGERLPVRRNKDGSVMMDERGLLDLPFLVLVVLSYIAGRLFPEIPATILTYFNEVVADSGIVRDDGSFSALALFGNNLRAMVLSTLYGFIPFLYLPALSMGVNAILLGMVAASVNGQWLLLAAGIQPSKATMQPSVSSRFRFSSRMRREFSRSLHSWRSGSLSPSAASA